MSWDRMQRVFETFALDQAGALAVGFLITFLICGDVTRLRSRRNLVVVSLLLIAPLLVDPPPTRAVHPPRP
jgi:hypothetical protein